MVRLIGMEQRHLGIDGLSVSTLGLGCRGLSPAYEPADDDHSIATHHSTRSTA
jgi:aryl-alcohol dehydrogenase-like predicted oxidoreductase